MTLPPRFAIAGSAANLLTNASQAGHVVMPSDEEFDSQTGELLTDQSGTESGVPLEQQEQRQTTGGHDPRQLRALPCTNANGVIVKRFHRPFIAQTER